MYDRRLAIESVTRLGPGQFVLAFECPEIAARCLPGHFVMVSVGGGIDPLLRRPMAVYAVLRDDAGAPRGFSMLIEVVGRGTALLHDKEPGDELRVLGPLGIPFDLPESGRAAGEQLLVMGGVGSAPFPLLAEELLARGHRVRAFVGARTAEALLCVGDFERLGVPVEISTDDGTSGYHGFVVGPLGEYLEANECADAALYACGPTPMMRAVHDIAMTRELPLQVSFEAPMACGMGVCLSCVLPVRDDSTEGWHYVRCCREGPVFDSRRMVWA
ncbi:MAG: dihydroorotate dehydrogenase electron transfer subunit [Acidobacteriota bacterium]|jgi:dihydroorotate dehydrogenase electron transfer subunit